MAEEEKIYSNLETLYKGKQCLLTSLFLEIL